MPGNSASFYAGGVHRTHYMARDLLEKCWANKGAYTWCEHYVAKDDDLGLCSACRESLMDDTPREWLRERPPLYVASD